MAVPVMQILGVVWGVVKYVVNEPIVNTALDHWTNGTSNKIDDAVWAFIERVAGAEHVSETARRDAVVAGVAKLQEEYDELKAAGRLDDLKTMTNESWNMAALFNGGRIALDPVV